MDKMVKVIALLFISSSLFCQRLPELVIQKGHTGGVSKMVFNSTGDKLVSVGEDKEIKVWDLKARKLLKSIDGFTEEDLVHVQFGVNDSIIITLEENRLRYFNIYKGVQIKSFEIEPDSYSASNYILQNIEESGVLALSLDMYEEYYIEFRDLQSGELIKRVGSYTSSIVSAQYNPLSQSIIYADYNQIYEYNLHDSSATTLYKYKKTKDGIANVICEGDYVYVFAIDGFVTILSSNDYSMISQEKLIQAKDYFYVKNHPFIVAKDGRVIYYDHPEGYNYELCIFKGDSKEKFEIDSRISAFAIDENNNWLAINQEEDIYFYSLKDYSLIFSFKNNTNWYQHVEPLNTKGCFIAVPFNSSEAYYWDLLSGKVTLHNLPQSVDGLSANPTSNEIAVSGGYNNSIVSLPDFTQVASNFITKDVEYFYKDAYVLPPGEYNIKYGHDGKTFATEYGGKCGYKVWDRSNMSLLDSKVIDDESQVVEYMDYRSDIGYLLIETSNNYFGNAKTRLVDLEKNKVVKEWTGNVNSVFFPKSKKAFVPNAIYDISTDAMLSVPGYGSHNWFNTKPDISTDEMFLAYCFKDSVVLVNLELNTYTLLGAHKGIEGVRFLNKENRLISFGKDGALRLWDAEDKKLVATFITESRENNTYEQTPVSYLIYTPDGYFMGPQNLFKLVAYNVDNKVYSFDQFDAIYNRPDIVLERLGYTHESEIDAYKTAYDKRRMRVGVVGQSTINVSITNKNTIPAQLKNKFQSLDILISDSSNNIIGYNVWLNGVAKYSRAYKEMNVVDRETTIKEELELVSGSNYIEISAVNNKGQWSLKEIVEIDCVLESDKDLYLVGIGMSRYSDSTHNLSYPVKDMQDLISYESSSSYFKNIHKLILQDSTFSRSSFDSIATFLEQSKSDDQVVIFYAGHGLLDDQQKYYLATWDMDFTQPEIEGFSFDTLEYLFEHVDSRERIMLIDACHSGLIDEYSEHTTTVDSNNEGIKIASRGVGRLTAGPDQTDAFEMMQSMFVNLNKGSGTSIISAAGGTQFAYESEKYSNGLFTYAYLDGLKTGKADRDKDGGITITEIKSYVEDMVIELSNGMQKPALRQMNYYNDFVVWAADDSEKNQFWRAAKENNVESLSYFLNRGFDVNLAEEKSKLTALHFAARQGNNDAIRFLLDNGAHVNAKSFLGWTPLILAAHNNNYLASLLLLLNGADKTIADNFGKTPLSKAKEQQNTAIVNLLENSDEVVNQIKVHEPVFNSLRDKDTVALRALLETEAVDVNYLSPEYGFGIIHVAASTGDVQLVQILLDYDANVNLLSEGGITPLMVATYRRDYKVMHCLLKDGADKKLRLPNGENVYNYADQKGKEILDSY